MTIIGVMYRGPFNGKPILLKRLDDVLLIRLPECRAILAYRREQEVDYVYDHGLSMQLSANYDHPKISRLPFTPMEVVKGANHNANLSGGSDAGDEGL